MPVHRIGTDYKAYQWWVSANMHNRIKNCKIRGCYGAYPAINLASWRGAEDNKSGTKKITYKNPVFPFNWRVSFDIKNNQNNQ